MKENNLVKYAITLLVVAIICITIGGISMSRSIIRNNKTDAGAITVTSKVAEISEENMLLSTENKTLREELSKYASKASQLEKENKAYSLYYDMQNVGDPVIKESIREEIKKLEINEDLKAKLTK